MIVWADLVDRLVTWLGGAAVIVSIASVWSAYNQYRMRKALERIEKKISLEEV